MPRPDDQTRPAPRKTPKQARSLETVAAIIEAAARILEERGHGGFSTNAVAKLAGASVGSLYQYYPSKDALIAALIVRETALLVEDTKAASLRPSGKAALSAFIAACITHQFRRPQLARLLDYEEARLPFDADTQRIGEEIQDLVSAILAKPDMPRVEDAETTSRETIAIIKGMIDAAGQHGDADQGALAHRVERATFGYLAIGSGIVIKQEKKPALNQL